MLSDLRYYYLRKPIKICFVYIFINEINRKEQKTLKKICGLTALFFSIYTVIKLYTSVYVLAYKRPLYVS